MEKEEIVMVQDNNINHFETKVNKLLDQGWRKDGPVAIFHIASHETMLYSVALVRTVSRQALKVDQ
jgi:hypothetical protein